MAQVQLPALSVGSVSLEPVMHPSETTPQFSYGELRHFWVEGARHPRHIPHKSCGFSDPFPVRDPTADLAFLLLYARQEQ